MEQVTREAVGASPQEASYILQVRPATPPEAEAEVLARHIDQFVGLYLGAAGLDDARFARLEALTWAISAPPGQLAAIEEVRADLAETLFGRADGEQVTLVHEKEPPAASEARAPSPEDGDVDLDDPFAGWEPSQSSAVTRAAMDDASDVLDLDAPDLDIIDSDVFEVDAWNVSGGAEYGDSDRFDPASTADLDAAVMRGTDNDGDDFDTLTETPERPDAARRDDLAAELAAFRAEMRDIAATIPGAGGDEDLARFRAELDSITGALGQRVDGAAQRIESAADRVADTVAGIPDAERMAGAVERAEASAHLMESSVREAVEALTAALQAMNNAAPRVEGDAQSEA
mgnify:FL=1